MRSVTVPAQSGRAAEVAAGDLVHVVDVDGHQVGDLWVIDANDHARWLSVGQTRDQVERLFPRVGDRFADRFGEPIAEFVADDSPGKHDMLFPPCDRWLYEREGLLDHPNCHDNFLAAAASAGIDLPVVPDPVNVFQNSAPEPDGTLVVGTAASEPGDSITLRVLRDAVVVLTACSVDYWPTNNMRCTPLLLRIESP
nr:urea carboxylase-associated family protein [Kibdelosporangium sp. MJ126-NF4]CEL23037.1 Aminomethyltransferase [Kibdelosporangium sp. MJ126-NF4]CTQ90176.1 Aminomethyltransferase (EC 2.1.2.10) [Kibdelosporangium sp. MJ126-NF4]